MTITKSKVKLLGYGLLILLALLLIIKSWRDNFVGISSTLTDQICLALVICLLVGTKHKEKLGFNIICWFITVALYACIPLIQKDLGNIVRANEYVASGLFGSFLYCFPFLFSALTAQLKIRALKTAASLFVYFLIFLVIAYPLVFYFYYLAEDAVFSADVVLAISQSNLKEAFDYASVVYGSLRFGYYLVIFLMLILAGFFIYRLRRGLSYVFIAWKDKAKVITLIFGCIFLCQLSLITLTSNKGFNCLPRQVITFSATILNSYRALEESSAQILAKTKVTHADGDEAGLYVLVIGESENKDFMSLYGYKDETTPLLKQLEQEGKILKFNQAYACFTHTVPVLSLALTSANQYNIKRLEDSLTLVDTAKTAGFKTYWISNQAKDSLVDTPVTYLAFHSDFKRFMTENSTENGLLYDGAVLDNIPQINTNEKTLVIIHLMGSHSVYRDRYPKAFERLKNDSDNIAAYENSVLYNDYVVHELYNYFSEKQNFKAFIYFSDHGADPTIKADHNISHFNWRMVRIPMVMAFSDGYKQVHPKIFTNLSNHTDRWFTNDLIYELMLGIMGIQVETDYSLEELDFSSADYRLDKSNAVTIMGQHKVLEDNSNQ